MKAIVIVLSSHYHTPHNLRHRHPEVHITLGPEERVEAVIAAASEQRGEGRLEGEGSRPRQPRADHPQPLRPRQALLLLDVVECLLEVLRRDVQCLQWLHRTMQASMSRAYLHLSLHVYEGCDHCDLQTCLLKPTCRLAACCLTT